LLESTVLKPEPPLPSAAWPLGVGVEKIFPLYSPMIDKIEIMKRSKVRRSKLYHIRDKAAKEIRRQMRNDEQLVVAAEPSC
jgi:hypothetical protein